MFIVAGMLFGSGIGFLGGAWVLAISRLEDSLLTKSLCVSFLLACLYVMLALLAKTWIDAGWFPLVSVAIASIVAFFPMSESETNAPSKSASAKAAAVQADIPSPLPDTASMSAPADSTASPCRKNGIAELFNQNWMLVFGFLLCIYIVACTWSAAINGQPISNNPYTEGTWGSTVGSLASAVICWLIVKAGSDRIDTAAKLLPLICVTGFLLAWFLGNWTSGPGRFFSNIPLGFGLSTFGLLLCFQVRTVFLQRISVTLAYGFVATLSIGFFLTMAAVWPVLGDNAASVLNLSLMVVYLLAAAISAMMNPLRKTGSANEKGADPGSASSQISIQFNLTTRESEILKLLVQGRGAPYIASELYVSVNTVKTHMKRIYQKTGVHSREELLDMVHEKDAAELNTR